MGRNPAEAWQHRDTKEAQNHPKFAIGQSSRYGELGLEEINRNILERILHTSTTAVDRGIHNPTARRIALQAALTGVDVTLLAYALLSVHNSQNNPKYAADNSENGVQIEQVYLKEPKFGDPYKYIPGKVTIHLDKVNIRKTPMVPDVNPNLNLWTSPISSIGGVSLNGANVIEINRPEVAFGDTVNIAGTNEIDLTNDWVMLWNINGTRNGYVKLGDLTIAPDKIDVSEFDYRHMVLTPHQNFTTPVPTEGLNIVTPVKSAK